MKTIHRWLDVLLDVILYVWST